MKLNSTLNRSLTLAFVAASAMAHAGGTISEIKLTMNPTYTFIRPAAGVQGFELVGKVEAQAGTVITSASNNVLNPPAGGTGKLVAINLAAISAAVQSNGVFEGTIATVDFFSSDVLGTYYGGQLTFTDGNVRSNPASFDVNLVQAVPEPASFAVFGLGAAGLLIRRKRA